MTTGGALALTLGTVAALGEGEEPQPGKAKVKLDLEENGTAQWMSVLSPFVGTGFGALFVPPAGVKALVGYIEGTDRCYVLGFFWEGQHPAPKDIPKSGLVMTTECGQRIVLDADKQTIEIADKQGNTVRIETEEKKVLVHSDGALTLSAKTQLTLTADENVTIAVGKSEATKLTLTQSAATVETEQLSVTANGEMQLKGMPIQLN